MNTKTPTPLSLLLMATLLGLLLGCSQARPVHQYTLISNPPPQALPQKASSALILIGPVKLASYLDQPRMVRRNGATSIDSQASHQWAGNLAEMISNKLVAELEGLLAPSPVFTFPSTTPFPQGTRVAIDILRFEGTADKTAVIEARWILYDLGNKAVIKSRSSLLQIPLSDDNHDTLASGLSQGLTSLAQEIGASIISENRQ